MKKRILAIFLCLILTVSLATAVAAKNDVITPGGTYTVTDNPSQPGPDDTPVPDNTTITLQIPIGKVVTLGGNTAPQRTTFSFNAIPIWAELWLQQQHRPLGGTELHGERERRRDIQLCDDHSD